MVYILSYAGFSMAAGKMSDRLGARSVICLGYATLLIGYFVLNGAHSPWPLAGGFLILGLFPALTAGVGGGYLWQTAGPATAYLAAGGVVVVGLVLLLVSSTKS